MVMKKKQYFNRINFNKTWNENDWEKFFIAQDDYRLSVQNQDIRKKPVSKIKFEGTDEVAAFDPILRAYGFGSALNILQELQNISFRGDKNPEEEYQPPTDEDPHYWVEGAPLASVLIYRDCCRFAICASQELDRHLKSRDKNYRHKFSAELESLRFQANWIAINVAEGHRLGYSEDRIQGNIAKVRRALNHAEVCIGLLGKLSKRTKSKRLRYELFSFAAQLRNGLFDWMDELRLRSSLA
jgi:hypothetical protein